ncbi:hypothetical protein [Pseudomonas sp. B19125]|uniref:hypothetical protein n=1 Tax=Pseudomonas sp. B19125 TaxID=3235109 RepID=UPI003782E460
MNIFNFYFFGVLGGLVVLCALCKESDDLRCSHLLPKCAYRVIGKSKRQKASPVFVRSKRNLASPTDYQYKKYLLCSSCEQLFSTREDIISKYWFRKPGFLLKEQLRQVTCYEGDDFARFYPVYPPVTLDEEDLYYFALSLLWRSCAGSWGDYEGVNGFSGKVLHSIGEYLLGRSSAPSNVRVLVFVDWSGVLEQIMTLPVGKEGKVQIVVLGLCIEIYVEDVIADPLVRSLQSLNQKVALILDNKRCAEVFGFIHAMARKTQEQ